MKHIVLVVIFIVGNLVTGVAQEGYKHSLTGIKKIKLETNTSVKVIAGSANEILFRKGAEVHCDDGDNDHDHNHSHGNHNYDYEHHDDDNKDHKDDKAKGLKAIYPGGVDNTGFGMSIEKDGDLLRVKDLKPFMQRHGFTITIPKSVNLNLNCGNLGSAHVEGVSGELEINSNVGHIHLVDVTGPVTAHSSTGGINVEFVSLNQSAPVSISSSTGDVDVTLPSNAKADVELKSTMGTVYSNFDLEVLREDGMKVVGATRKVKGRLNNGGVKLYLSSSTGNIYFRKK